jgi:NADH dehydrogenase/NADH:ubiquinone oxidoreductase subunit G
MIHLTIDNQQIKSTEDRTLLEACRENGIHIPTLCYYPSLEPYGACRLCIVEIAQGNRPSRLVASCAYPCEDGLVVMTNSEAVQKSRRVTLELLLASAYQTPEILALAEELGVTKIRYKLPDADSCILCGLCVRACHEIVGVGALSLIHRGIQKAVSPPFEVTSSVCIGCGTCVLICPTGRLKLEDVYNTHSDHQFSSTHDHALCKLCGDTMVGAKMALPQFSVMDVVKDPSLGSSDNGNR